jgi:hypothetical protein
MERTTMSDRTPDFFRLKSFDCPCCGEELIPTGINWENEEIRVVSTRQEHESAPAELKKLFGVEVGPVLPYERWDHKNGWRTSGDLEDGPG